MLDNFSLFTHPCDMSSLFLKGERSSRSDYKKVQGAGTKLIQHCYKDVCIVAGLCWRCFSPLYFLDSNYIHKLWNYSCIYHFSRFSFVEFSFICNACGVTSLFSSPFLFYLAWIDNLTISFYINNYKVFTFTMITIPFGLIRDLTVFAISSAMISYITLKSLINKIWICIFHVTHFSSTTKFLSLNWIFFFSYKIFLFYLSLIQSNYQICLVR